VTRPKPLLPVYVGLFLCAVFWGVTFPAGRIAVMSVPPMTVAFVRFLIAGLLLEVWVRRRGEGRQKVPFWPIVWSAAAGILAYSVFFFHGLRLSSAVEGSLIVPTNNPLAMVLLAAIFLGERLRPGEIAGFILAAAGVFTIVGGTQALRGVQAEHLSGNLLFIGCVLSWATYSILGKVAMSRVSPLLATTRVIQAGALMILPVALLEDGRKALAAAPVSAWIAILTLALPATVLAYVWWYEGIGRLGASRAAMFIYLVPVSGVLSAHLVLGEPILARHLTGALFIAAGLIVAHWGTLRTAVAGRFLPPPD
jgi:drug/metabolite transporter (DMT)-like permease